MIHSRRLSAPLALALLAGCASAAPAPVGPGSPGVSAASAAAELEPYEQSIPGTLVDLELVPVPGPDGPLWMSATEIPWDVYDVYVFGLGGSGAPSPEAGVSRPSQPYILPGDAFGHEGHPAVGVTYFAAEKFTEWLSAATGHRYRLPTGEEWELACRAGGGVPADLSTQVWYRATAGARTHPVGTLEPNRLGLHDLLGNAAEWVSTGDGEGVVKGGSFESGPPDLTCELEAEYDPSWQMTDPQLPKSRWWLSDAPFVGFRVVREP